MLLDVPKERDSSVEELFERLVVLILFHLLLVELPKTLDEIEIRGVWRDERQDDVQLFGFHRSSVVVLGIVEQHNDRNLSVGILSPQLFKKCLHHQRVAIVLGEQDRRQEREGIESAENSETLAAAVAQDVDGVSFSLQLPLLPVLAVMGRMGGIGEDEDDRSFLRLFKEIHDLLHPFLLDVHRGVFAGDQLGFLERCREFFLA